MKDPVILLVVRIFVGLFAPPGMFVLMNILAYTPSVFEKFCVMYVLLGEL